MALNLGPLNVLLNLKGAKKFEDDAQKVTGSMSSIVGASKGSEPHTSRSRVQRRR